MVAVPEETPVTTPVLPTVATAVLDDDHTPPPEGSVRVIVLPAQTDDVPVIEPAIGSGLTVTTCVATTLPQLLATE